jgi:hypothetical protein
LEFLFGPGIDTAPTKSTTADAADGLRLDAGLALVSALPAFADVYAEGLRRGGALVSARVADADAARLQAIMDNSAVRVTERAAAYRKSGWKTFDPNAGPYNADQVKKERSLYM